MPDLHPGDKDQDYRWTSPSPIPPDNMDYPDELACGFHVTLDDGAWVTVKQDQSDVVLPT